MANRFKRADPWSAFLLVYGWGNRVKRHTIISPLQGSRLPLGNNHFSIEMSPLRGFLCGLVIRQVALIGDEDVVGKYSTVYLLSLVRDSILLRLPYYHTRTYLPWE